MNEVQESLTENYTVRWNTAVFGTKLKLKLLLLN